MKTLYREEYIYNIGDYVYVIHNNNISYEGEIIAANGSCIIVLTAESYKLVINLEEKHFTIIKGKKCQN